jgi:predicted ATPase
MEKLYATRLEDRYAALAHHFFEGNDTEKAINYLKLAGQQAGKQSAYEKAIGHLTTALELLYTLPDTPERAREELTLQIVLGPPLRAAKGYGSPEAERVYTRVRELSQVVGDTSQLFQMLHGLWAYYCTRGEPRTGRDIAKQIMCHFPRA